MEASRLVVNEPGLFIGVRRGRLLIRDKEGERLLSFTNIDMVAVLTRGAYLSTALLRELARRRKPLVVYSRTGYPVAWVSYVKGGSVETRKKQVRLKDSGLGGALAKSFVWGKIQNQRSLLMQAARNRKNTNPGLARALRGLAEEMRLVAGEVSALPDEPPQATRQAARRLEAEAARLYWEGFKLLVPEHVGFDSRRKRYENPRDLANALLNYSYGLLAADALLAVVYAGLDPYVGFLHEDYERRPALVMDLMEEFRAPVVDRAVLRLLQQTSPGQRALDENHMLTREWRARAYKAFASRMRERVTFENRSLALEDHVVRQARKLAAAVNLRTRYTPFLER